MKVSNILLDRETKEIKIFFEHTNHCVRAPFTWQNIQLYEHFNGIERAETEVTQVINYQSIVPNSVIEDLIAL